MTKAKSADEAEDTVDEPTPDAPEVVPYISPIEDPVEETPDETPQEAPRTVPEGEVEVEYLGSADSFEHGEYTFRPGQPVIVPSEVAEELLTFPNEKFALKE